jgi:hypothetical protein
VADKKLRGPDERIWEPRCTGCFERHVTSVLQAQNLDCLESDYHTDSHSAKLSAELTLYIGTKTKGIQLCDMLCR